MCVQARATEEPGGGSEDDGGDGSDRESSDENGEEGISRLETDSGGA